VWPAVLAAFSNILARSGCSGLFIICPFEIKVCGEWQMWLGEKKTRILKIHYK
jgi:hypothetical protein